MDFAKLSGRRIRLGALLLLVAGAPGAEAAAIRNWELATPVPARFVGNPDVYPHFSAIFALDWLAATADAEGKLELEACLPLPSAEPHTVLARAWLRSERWQRLALSFAYRDAAVAFWNGQPVFRGETGAPDGGAGALPPVGDDTALPLPVVVFLTAAPGLNELMLAVTARAGSAAIRCESDRELLPPLVDHGRLVEQWRTEPVLRTPESVVIDRRRGQLYVSNFNAGYDPAASDPAQFTGFVSRLSLTGEILEREWVGRLKAPAGLALDGDTLWVVERGGVARVDVLRGAVVARIPLPDAEFPNDIALGPDGYLYVTDTRPSHQPDSRIYRIADGRAEIWEGGPVINRANGLCRDGERLLVGNSGDGLFKSIALAGRRIEPIVALGGGIQDGIRVTPEGELLVSHWEGKIFAVSPSGLVVEIADLKAEQLNAADYEYLPESQQLVVPTFSGNRVIAYHLIAGHP